MASGSGSRAGFGPTADEREQLSNILQKDIRANTQRARDWATNRESHEEYRPIVQKAFAANSVQRGIRAQQEMQNRGRRGLELFRISDEVDMWMRKPAHADDRIFVIKRFSLELPTYMPDVLPLPLYGPVLGLGVTAVSGQPLNFAFMCAQDDSMVGFGTDASSGTLAMVGTNDARLGNFFPELGRAAPLLYRFQGKEITLADFNLPCLMLEEVGHKHHMINIEALVLVRRSRTGDASQDVTPLTKTGAPWKVSETFVPRLVPEARQDPDTELFEELWTLELPIKMRAALPVDLSCFRIETQDGMPFEVPISINIHNVMMDRVFKWRSDEAGVLRLTPCKEMLERFSLKDGDFSFKTTNYDSPPFEMEFDGRLLPAGESDKIHVTVYSCWDRIPPRYTPPSAEPMGERDSSSSFSSSARDEDVASAVEVAETAP